MPLRYSAVNQNGILSPLAIFKRFFQYFCRKKGFRIDVKCCVVEISHCQLAFAWYISHYYHPTLLKFNMAVNKGVDELINFCYFYRLET